MNQTTDRQYVQMELPFEYELSSKISEDIKIRKNGSNINGYWTFEKCKEEAEKYHSRSEFAMKNGSAYRVALKNKWLSMYTWFEDEKTRKMRRKEKRYKICVDCAKKCHTRSEFAKLFPYEYMDALKNDWIDEYLWFEDGRRIYSEKRRIYTKDKVIYLASDCVDMSDFRKKHYQAYSAACHNGWIEDIVKIIPYRKVPSYTREEILTGINRMSTYQEFTKSKYYKAACRRNLLPLIRKLLPNKPRSFLFWTKERCFSEAKKYKTFSEFRKCCPSGAVSARIHHFDNEYTWLRRLPNPYIEKIHVVYGYFFLSKNTFYIGRTNNIKRRDWCHRHDGAVHKFALVNNIEIPEVEILKENLTLEESLYYEDALIKEYKVNGWNAINKAATGIKSGSIGTLSHNWSENRIIQRSKNFKTMKEFRTQDKKAYYAALRRRMLGKLVWLKRNERGRNSKSCIIQQEFSCLI